MPTASTLTQTPAPLVLNTQGGGLIFLQIVEHYRQQILQGIYRKGEKLPTCREIAAPLGVSPQTVNRALDQLAREGLLVRRRALGSIVSWGGGPRVAVPEKKREAPPVPMAAPSALPVGLVAKVSALSPGEGDLFMDYLNGIVEGFDAFGMRLELIEIKPDQPDVEVIEPLVRLGRVCGLVMIGLQASAVDFLIQEAFPVVSINSDLTARGITSVIGNDLPGYEKAWEYAEELGHREAVFVTGSGSATGQRRVRLCAAGRELVSTPCRLREPVFFPRTGSSDELWAQFETAWGQWHDDPKCRDWPTLFFSGSDVTASCLLQMFTERGIRVPEQVSVIGYSDSVIASHLSPPLTTLTKPRRAMAVAAAQLLIDILARRPSSREALRVFPVELTRRASCASPAL